MTERRTISLDDAMSQVDNLDLLFFHSMPLSQAVHPLQWFGMASNRAIRRAQWMSSDHRHFHEFIHVELIMLAKWFVGDPQPLTFGMMNKRGVDNGLSVDTFVRRVERYPYGVLWVPLSQVARERLDPDTAMAYIEEMFTAGYAMADCIRNAESRNPRREYTEHNAFCSEFVVEALQSAGVLPLDEPDWDEQEKSPVTIPMEGYRFSPKDILQRWAERPDLFDWERAAIIVP